MKKKEISNWITGKGRDGRSNANDSLGMTVLVCAWKNIRRLIVPSDRVRGITFEDFNEYIS